MNIKFISITKPILKEIENFDSEQLLSYIARVSNPSNQMNTLTSAKLLKYCIKNKHWSVFEHINMTFEITTSLAIATQILRHRSFTFQQFSQRYSKSELEFEPIEFRLQDNQNRQNSIDITDWNNKYEYILEQIYELQHSATLLYNLMLQNNIAKEVARFILPQNCSTTLYMTGNLRSWLHYIELRADKATQKEHRIIADAIKEILAKEFISLFGAENEN